MSSEGLVHGAGNDEQILRMLRGTHAVSTVDFIAAGYLRAGGSIERLRAEGHDITTTLVGGVGVYRLDRSRRSKGTRPHDFAMRITGQVGALKGQLYSAPRTSRRLSPEVRGSIADKVVAYAEALIEEAEEIAVDNAILDLLGLTVLPSL